MMVIVLASVWMLGCTHSLSWSSNLKFSISGKVESLLIQSGLSTGNPQVLSCTTAVASLYKLKSDGSKIAPALAVTNIAGDGSYSFSDVRSIGIETTSSSNTLVGGYTVEITGCSKAYSRIITGFETQDVTIGSTLVSSIAQTSQASVIPTADRTKVAALISSLNTYADYSSAYTALTTDSQLSTEFTSAFGVSPSTLVNASPTLVSATVPTTASEHDVIGLAITGSQWNSSYQYAYLWEFDGSVISTVQNPNYTVGGNSQGTHTVSVFYGQQDANGNLDQTKPFGSKSYSLQIPNNILPVSPVLTAPSVYVNSAAVPLTISTGASFADCDSFSHLAITEDDPVSPLAASSFTISCTQAPSQNLTYTLLNGAGVHTLRLWAMDAAGVVSQVSSNLSVTYSLVVPLIHITSPVNAGPFKPNLTISGDCDINSGDVTVKGAIQASPITTACNSASYSQAVVLTGADGTKSITAQQTNSYGTTGSANISVTLDSTSPSAVLSTSITEPTNASSIPVTLTFSETVTSVDQSKITVSNGTLSNFSGSGSVYIFNVVPLSQGAVSINVEAGSAQDAAGNLSLAAATLSRTYDSVQSSVTTSSSVSSPTNLSSIPVTIQFSKPVLGFTISGLSLTNATASALSGSGSTYTFILNPTAQGSVSVLVSAGSAHDAAGNLNTASASLSKVYDSVQPTVLLSTAAAATTNSNPIPVTVTFSKAVTGFSASGISVSNATVSGFTGSGASYSFNLIPSAQGSVAASVTAGSAHDSAGNLNTASTSLSRVFDSTAPTVLLSTTTLSPTNSAAIPVSIQFSKSVTGLSLSSFAVTNGSVSGLTGSGTTYSLSLMPSSQGTVSISVNSATAHDAATNGNTVSNTLSLVYDTTQPGVTLATSALSPTNLSSIPVTVTFTKSVTGLSLASLTVTNGTASALTGSGTTYAFSVTPSTQGAVGISIASGKVSDTAGNLNTVSNTLSVTYDTVAPVLTLSTAVSSPTSQSAITINIASSKVVSGLTLSNFVTTNGTVSTLTGSGSAYALTLTPSAVGTVTIKVGASAVADTAGNQNAESNLISIDYNNISPSVTLTSAQSSPTNSGTIAVAVHFSSAVTGFTVSSLTLSNATASAFSGSGTDYSFNLLPSAQGSVSASVASGKVMDAASNLNNASNVLSFVYDTTQPTVSLSSTSPPSLNTSPIPVTVTFSKSVAGFSLSKLNLTNATAANLTGSDASYSFNLIPSGQGTLSVSTQANAATDQAGNSSLASSALTRTFDTTSPTVTISSSISSPSNLSSIPLTVVFSKSATGISLSSFTVANGTVSTLVGTGTSYSVNLIPSSQGSVSVLLNAAAGTDQSGNTSVASNTFSITYDTTQPTAVLATTSGSPTNVSPVPMSLAFSKSVSGLTLAGLSVTNGTASALTGSGTSYTYSVTPSAQGPVSTALLANKAQDSAGNQNVASNSVSVTYDTIAPVLAFTSPAANSYVNLANQTSITVGGTCSKTGIVNLAVGGLSQAPACTSGNFSATFDLHTLSDGNLALTANTTDSAGNAAIQKTLSLNKDTSTPTSTISGQPTSPSRSTTLNITVGGTNVSHYMIKVGASGSTDCTTSTGYSSENSVSTHITSDISNLSDSTIKLCVVGRTPAGNYQSFASSTSFTWVKDTAVTPFTSLAVTPSSPGNNVKPSLSGSTEGLSVIQMYSLASCVGSILGSTTANASGVFNVQATSAIGSDGSYNFSLLSTDVAGNTLCSSPTTGYLLDTTPPSVLISSISATNTNASPIPVSVTFSESVTGFTTSSVTVVNGTISAFTGSGTTYSFSVTPSAQGALSVSVAANQASDQALNGNLVSNTLSRTYDSVAPSLTIATPAASSFTNQTSVVLSGGCETGLTVSVSGTGISTTGTTPCTSSAYSTSVALTSGDGVKNISVSQTDSAANTSTAALAITLDQTAPAIAFTSTAIQNQNSNGNSVTFTGSCESGLSIAIAGGTDSTTTTCSSGSFSYPVVAQSTDATRTYTFKQTDLANNSTLITGNWIRDSVAPALTLTSPAANFAAQTSITLTGACESGINVAISGTGILSSIAVACSASSYSQLVYFSSSDGAKAVTVAQTDLAGNTTSVSRSFVRDTTAPAITQTTNASPYNSKNSTATFGGACEYNSTTAIPVVISGADSANVTCSSSSTWTYTTASQTTDGSRTYTFKQTDPAGNVGTISATWVRDTVAPALTITSNSAYLTSGNTVTFSGICESGLNVVVTGSVSTSTTCSGGSWSYAPTSSTDGTINFTFTQTDLATNSTSVSGSWQRSTSGPVITITQTSPQTTNGSTLAISGTCGGGTAGSSGTINITGAATGSVTCSSTNSTIGSWSYNATNSTDGTYNYTFTTTDNFTTPRSSNAAIQWVRDATPPVITSGSLTINGGTNSTTAVSYNPVSFNSTDNLSKIVSFCLKSTSTAPLASDSCWYQVNGSATNVTPSNNVSISNYLFNIGIVPQAYSYYMWVLDGAGNISANAASSGTDLSAITLQPIAPPSVSTVLVSNSDTMNGATSERVITAGSNVYIRWTASGSSLSATPVTLFFTADDSNYTQIAAGLGNGVNNCSSLQGSGSAPNTATGCYKWNGGSPSSSYYKIRVSVTNSNSATSFANSQPINADSVQILAGNTETGLNGSAASGIFQTSYANGGWIDPQSIAVSSKGTIYVRDITNGLVQIDPTNGKMTPLLGINSAGGSGVGDGGSIYSAKLKYPSSIAIDAKDRVYILDYDRIRRIDFSSSPPTINTIIGGGTDSSTDTPTPTGLKFVTTYGFYSTPNQKNPLIVAPSGDTYFYSDANSEWANKRLRVYTESTKTIRSIYMTGTSGTLNNTGTYQFADFSKCGNSYPLVEFDSSSSAIKNLYFSIGFTGGSTNSGCTTTASTVGSTFSSVIKVSASGAYDSSVLMPGYVGGNNFFYGSPVPALDGKVYAIFKNAAVLGVYDSSANTWTTIAGTGTRGNCNDGTTATSCNIDFGGAFVDSKSQVYFIDRGRIRTIVSGKIATIYGQSVDYGDGGLATNARFSKVQSLVQRSSDSALIVNDVNSDRLREFPRSGTIQTIAGNGITGNSSTSTNSINTAMPSSPTTANFYLDNLDNIYFNITASTVVATLPSSKYMSPGTASWSYLLDANSKTWFGGTTPFYNSGTSGTQVGSLSLPNLYDPRIMAYNGTSTLVLVDQIISGSRANIIYAEVNNQTGVYTIDINAGSTAGNFCAAGTSMSSCGSVPISNIWNSWDSATSSWIMLDGDSKTVRSFQAAQAGSMQTLGATANTAGSFVFQRFSNYSSDAYLYYCASNGRIYLRDLTTASEVALNWPVSTIACTGTQLVYDSQANSVIFPFTQNGLSGVAEVLNAHPSANGL